MVNRRKHRGQRSDRSTQRREAARIVSQHAVRDLMIKESINVLHPSEIAYLLTNTLGSYDAWVVGRYDVGEVLSDMYCRGSQQKMEALV